MTFDEMLRRFTGPECRACRCTLTPENRPRIGFSAGFCADCEAFRWEMGLSPADLIGFVEVCWGCDGVE